MQGIILCPECNVPELFTRQHLWLNNGDIVHRENRSHRLVFIECGNLDPLYRNIGEIIGLPIDRLVINIESRGVESYLAPIVPKEMRDTLLSMRPGDAALGERCRQLIDALNEANTTLAAINGTGKYEVLDYRYERDKNDYSIIRVTNPDPVLMVVSVHAGQVAALVGAEHKIDYKEVSPGVYELTSESTEYDDELRERLKIKEYFPREGDIELARCGTCGGPAALSEFRWYPDKGIVKSTLTGRRMAILGPSFLDPVFEELEKELGEGIPRAVVEAQRRIVKTGFYSIGEFKDEERFRNHFALRGLGNLKRMEMDRKGARLRIDNSNMYLAVVGLIQGIFEMTFDVDSRVEWELSEEGDLTVEVTAES